MRKVILVIMSLLMSGTSIFAQRDTIKDREVGLVFSSLNSFGLCYKWGDRNTLFRITAVSLSGSNSTSGYSSPIDYDGIIYPAPSSPSNSLGGGLNIGIEKRNRINERLYFYYGLNLTGSYAQSNNTTVSPTSTPLEYTNSNNVFVNQYTVQNNSSSTNSWELSGGVGIIIGVAYKLNRYFSIGAELIPTVSYSYTETNSTGDYYSVSWVGSSATGYKAETYEDVLTDGKVTKGINYSVLNNNAAITIAYRIK